MKLRYFILGGALLLAVSCKKETQLEPSNKDENYLVNKDNPNDATDHAIFNLYKEFGIPIFYNDTLTRKQVGDTAGVPIYFYNRLFLKYTITGTYSPLTYQLEKDKAKILPFLRFLREELILKIPTEKVFIPSILAVSSLNDVYFDAANSREYNKILIAYNGFNTWALKIVNPDTMSVASKASYVAQALSFQASKILSNTRSRDLETKFYSISSALHPTAVYEKVFTTLTSKSTLKTLPQFGFLALMPGVLKTNPTTKNPNTPTQLEDLRMYIVLALLNTNAQVNAQYGTYAPVMKKYAIIKEMLNDLQFSVPD